METTAQFGAENIEVFIGFHSYHSGLMSLLVNF